MTSPIERFKDAYYNWRYNPFTAADMAVDASEDGLIIPSGSPFIIQLSEQARYNDPSSVAVRCYGVDTFVDETSASGQPILKVDDTTDFSPGDNVIINRGGAREEEKIIDTVQAGVSLTMTVNLEYEHTAGQADVVEKFIAFTETAGAPAQSQFRVDYPPDDGGKGTGLVEFNTNDANKEVRITYKATGSPALAETLDTKISYPTGTPADNQIIGFSSGAPYWLQLPHANLAGLTADNHHPQTHSLASHSTKAHSELTGVSANQHHPQAHSLASHSSKAHSELTGVGANNHHPQAHTLASHSTKAHSELTGIGTGDHHARDHKARHQSGGDDAIKLDDLAAPDDNADLNASITKHGLLKKLSNSADEFLGGTGLWAKLVSAGGIIAWILSKPTDRLQHSNDAMRVTTSETMVKMKETRLDEDTGKMRIYFDLKRVGGGAGETASAKIYVNGSPVGTLRVTLSTTYVPFTEDLGGYSSGDLIQIYGMRVPTASCNVANFRFKYDRAVTKIGAWGVEDPIPVTPHTAFNMTNQDP